MTDSGWLAPRSLCHLSLRMKCYSQSTGHFGFYTQKIHSRTLFCSKQAHMVYLVLQMWWRHRQEFFRLGIPNLCPFLINHRILEHSWWPLFSKIPNLDTDHMDPLPPKYSFSSRETNKEEIWGFWMEIQLLECRDPLYSAQRGNGTKSLLLAHIVSSVGHIFFLTHRLNSPKSSYCFSVESFTFAWVIWKC